MSDFQVKQMLLGALRTNCYLMIRQDTKETLIVDPADGAEVVISKMNREGLKPVAILLTHGHVDHIGAAEGLKNHYGISIYAGEKETELLGNPGANLSRMFGQPIYLKSDIQV